MAGNKTDLSERVVPTQRATKFADEHNMLYFELSTKENVGIDDMFNATIEKLLQH